jgi:hypothetical protein
VLHPVIEPLEEGHVTDHDHIVVEWDALHRTGDKVGDADVVLVDGALRTVDPQPSATSIGTTTPDDAEAGDYAVRRLVTEDGSGAEVEVGEYHVLRPLEGS